MAPHSSTLAWKIQWAEEPGGLQSMGWWRVRHDWATSLSLFTFMHWRRKWQPTPVFLPGEFQGWGAWWAAVYGVAQSRTRLKRRSSSRVYFGASQIPVVGVNFPSLSFLNYSLNTCFENKVNWQYRILFLNPIPMRYTSNFIDRKFYLYIKYIN